jgi:type IV secretory pathway VirB10-like protein
MSEAQGIRQRIAARDALASRVRILTSAALAVAAALSGVFAGIAAASAPGHKLNSGTSARRTHAVKSRRSTARSSKAIPPLPAAPGPGNDAAAPPPAPTPAPAPSPTQSPPVVVSGGS